MFDFLQHMQKSCSSFLVDWRTTQPFPPGFILVRTILRGCLVEVYTSPEVSVNRGPTHTKRFWRFGRQRHQRWVCTAQSFCPWMKLASLHWPNSMPMQKIKTCLIFWTLMLGVNGSLSTNLQCKLNPNVTQIYQPMTDQGVANSALLIGFHN